MGLLNASGTELRVGSRANASSGTVLGLLPRWPSSVLLPSGAWLPSGPLLGSLTLSARWDRIATLALLSYAGTRVCWETVTAERRGAFYLVVMCFVPGRTLQSHCGNCSRYAVYYHSNYNRLHI